MASIVIGRPLRSEDDLYDAHRQRLLDAFLEGRRVGALLLPMSLCPPDMPEDERVHWLDGWRKATAEKVAPWAEAMARAA